MQRLKVFETKNSRSKEINYKNPPMPRGFSYVCGEWDNGYVIENQFDGSQFVWVPVGALEPNGTLDGNFFTEKLGRRYWIDEKFSPETYNEPLTAELSWQKKSVQKYGGFYISRYCISKSDYSYKPMSVKGKIPWTSMDFAHAKMVAEWFESSSDISSHLMYGAEYDTVMEWLIESGAKTRREVVQYSSAWGNYWNSSNSAKSIATVGSKEEWCVNNIFDLAGNVKEWTQERFGDEKYVLRGGSNYDDGISHPVVKRTPIGNNYVYYGAIFRVTLCLK